MNMKGSEFVAIVDGSINPKAYTAATYNSGWIKADSFERYMAVVQAGTLGASATLDAKLQQATDGAGAGVKDVTGHSITQLTQAGSDSNKQAIINLNPAQALDLDNGFYWFRLSITVGTATSDAGGIVLGVGPKSGLASSSNASTVDEVVQ